MTDETYETLGQQLRAFLFETAKIIGSISVISVPLGWFGLPLIDAYINNKISDFVVALEETKKEQIIEFRGNGIVMEQGPFKPGDQVPILFLLKSKGNCHRDIEMRFIGPSGSPMTHLTQLIKATQAPITQDFIPFTITITIPSLAPDGPLVYGAIVRPINCPQFADQVVVPFSTVIMVKK